MLYTRVFSLAHILLCFVANILFTAAWMAATGGEPSAWARLAAAIPTVVVVLPAERALVRRHARRRAARRQP